jgi:hypothetical protein
MKSRQFKKGNPAKEHPAGLFGGPDCSETCSVDIRLSVLFNPLHLEPHTPLETYFDVRTSMIPPPKPQNQNQPNRQGRCMKVEGTKQDTIRVGKSNIKVARHHRQRLVIGSKDQYKALMSLQGKPIVSKWRRQENFSSRSTTCVRPERKFARSTTH